VAVYEVCINISVAQTVKNKEPNQVNHHPVHSGCHICFPAHIRDFFAIIFYTIPLNPSTFRQYYQHHFLAKTHMEIEVLYNLTCFKKKVMHAPTTRLIFHWGGVIYSIRSRFPVFSSPHSWA